jgi:DNA-binding transcriptional ArsR family regulator
VPSNSARTAAPTAPSDADRALRLVDERAGIASLLNPLRRRLLEELAEPDSASGLARRLSLPRQRLNYHLRELEREGLLELVEERRRGNCTERIVRASARSYLLVPSSVGDPGAEAERVRDRFSSAYLIAVATRLIREVAGLRAKAQRDGTALPTFTLQTDVRFASPAALHAFTGDLAREVARLAARHHDEGTAAGRTFRFILGAHPAPPAATGDVSSAPDPPQDTPETQAPAEGRGATRTTRTGRGTHRRQTPPQATGGQRE